MVIDCIDLWRFACLCELLHRTYIVGSYCCIVNIAGTCCTHVRMILSMASLEFVECDMDSFRIRVTLLNLLLKFYPDSCVASFSALQIESGFGCWCTVITQRRFAAGARVTYVVCVCLSPNRLMSFYYSYFFCSDFQIRNEKTQFLAKFQPREDAGC
jgi:hypothetical protein